MLAAVCDVSQHSGAEQGAAGQWAGSASCLGGVLWGAFCCSVGSDSLALKKLLLCLQTH